ncbi:MAG: response regulator transcription factor [Labilithrix sp.]|nr:response regulator transcription factor [Labilithrix sp.]MBX3222777.1 response regulator transcription factor [Labilithrix sp.]
MKVLVVEDDKKLARFLAQALTEEGYVVDTCSRGRDALVQASHIGYSLIVLDWMLPDLDGVTVCRQLRRTASKVPILMLTARGEVGERVTGLDAGADDYMTKPFELEELLARVRAAIRRGQSEPQKLRVGALTLDFVERIVHVDGKRLDLTPREYSLLALFAKNAGRVVPRSEILSQVWETLRDPGSNVIEVNVKNVRDKLGEAGPTIETVRGVGYRMLLIEGKA